MIELNGKKCYASTVNLKECLCYIIISCINCDWKNYINKELIFNRLFFSDKERYYHDKS